MFLILDYRYIQSAKVFTPEELIPVKAVNWASEHLPAWVDETKVNKSNDRRNRIIITNGEGKAEIIAWKSADRTIAVTAKKPLTLKIRTFNFPGWTAYIDAQKTEIRTVEGEGAMLIDIPSGKHTLILKFQDTPVRYYSKFVSLISFSVLILTLILLRR
jgi:hypothetical protein